MSGRLYKIMVKEEGEDGAGHVMPFVPNFAQRDFLNALHYRNLILKARQLGFTTLIAIMWLDHALFVPDQRCGIIAHSLEDAEAIFRDKVKFAYFNLPAPLLARFPLARDSAKELLFAHNNSAIRVATSMRSGTIHRLHISEMGKIAAKDPGKAIEIVTGSLPAVPMTGVAVIESTAEGQEGEFYNIATRAEALAEMGRMPNASEWMFHFYPWHSNPAYEMDPSGVVMTAADHDYFAQVEADQRITLSLRQRAWYVAKRENDFSGDPEKMWREMPSTSGECWRKSTEGTFYAVQLARARVEGRITAIPHVEQVPVHTFWDIGSGDGTGIWGLQHVGPQHRFLRYWQGWGEGYAHYIRLLRETGWVFAIHWLPHDADHERQMQDKVGKPIDMLRELAPDWRFEIVPRVQHLQHGIDLTRAKFGQAWFDEAGTRDGLEHVALYRKKWNRQQATWSHEPEKLDGHSEAADSLRQWAQGFNPALFIGQQRPNRRGGRIGGMAT